MMFVRTSVPNCVRPCEVTGFSLIFFSIFTRTVRYFSGSAIAGIFPPLTTTAFRFFDAITAPTPFLPAALCLSFTTDAIFTMFSPAGPMHATLVFPPILALSISVVSNTSLPHKSEASRSSAFPSSTKR